MSTPRRNQGRIHFEDWSMPDPNWEPLRDAIWRAGNAHEHLTEADMLRLRDAASAYLHFVEHPAPTHRLVSQLRRVRRFLRTGK